jgi:hypothetical protein
MFAKAYSGFPVELAGAGELYAAFLNESRTRGRWWRPVQEIRIRGPKTMGEAQRSLSLFALNGKPVKDTLQSPAATPDHSPGRVFPLPLRRRLPQHPEPFGRTLPPPVCLTDRQASVERQS